jgi:oxaloacetate decarboxylase gamma subunit
MIEQGLELVLFGMGTVFVFLTMLVFVTGLMSTLVLKFSAPIPQSSKAATEGDTALMAAAVAAVKRYREDHKH